MDYIRRFFGLPQENSQYKKNFYWDKNIKDNVEDEQHCFSDHNNHHRPNFHVFSDPLHMQQYFEYQMNEMLKFFGAEEFDNELFSNFYSNNPALQEESGFNETQDSSKDLREQFLKNGYIKPSEKNCEKMDKDIDERVDLGELDSMFGKKHNKTYYDYTSEGLYFGHSQSLKTVQNPDGSIETHSTVRDNKGNEETTICKIFGDKEYCISKKTDRHGKEEITENLVNMNEEEKNALLGIGDNLHTGQDKIFHNIPFADFFK